MARNTISITIEDEDGDEHTHELPARNEVCHECDGHGTVLREGMRGHAYTAEEFFEEFDEEERQEYFTRGGRYDVQCPVCKGANVVPVIDKEWEDREEM